METIGDRIKRLRTKKGLTQHELSVEIGGVQPRQISDWENNRADPSAKNLKKIATYFKVNAQWILGLDKTGGEDPLALNIENPYKTWSYWLLEMAPKDLTIEEQLILCRIRFSAEPEPWRYNAILEQIRGPGTTRASGNTDLHVKTIKNRKKN